MKLPNKKLLSIAIFLALIAFAINYLINNISEFKQLSLTNLYLIIPITIIFMINYVLLGMVNIYLLKPLKLNIGFLEGFQLSIVNGFYNLITPFRGGMAAKAIYLKEKHNFPYTKFLATIAASYVIIFLIASFVGILSMYFIYTETGMFSLLIFFIFLFFLIPLLIIVIFSPKFPETKYKWVNGFIKVMNGWNLIKNNKRMIIIITLLSFIQLLLGALIIYLSFMVFGIEISYFSSLFLASIGSLGILLAITPAGLGVTETITIFSALTIGITPAESLPVALIGRVVSLIVLFILGPIFSYKLLKNTQKNVKKN